MNHVDGFLHEASGFIAGMLNEIAPSFSFMTWTLFLIHSPRVLINGMNVSFTHFPIVVLFHQFLIFVQMFVTKSTMLLKYSRMTDPFHHSATDSFIYAQRSKKLSMNDLFSSQLKLLQIVFILSINSIKLCTAGDMYRSKNTLNGELFHQSITASLTIDPRHFKFSKKLLLSSQWKLLQIALIRPTRFFKLSMNGLIAGSIFS